MLNETEERAERDKIEQQFEAEEINIATEAVVKYEVEKSYKLVPWRKGVLLLEELRKLGYTISKI